jgi:hypothetical protein
MESGKQWNGVNFRTLDAWGGMRSQFLEMLLRDRFPSMLSFCE